MNATDESAAPRSAAAPADDSTLLHRYAYEGSQDAFAELVRRRIGLVYSVALRQTGDRGRAEDVTQSVFTVLARKARQLADRPVLAGWLYQSTRLAAAELQRAEQRRHQREHAAHTMETLLNENARDEDWQKVRAVLDDALNEINERDRDAIVLRFFDGQPFAAIGARLRLTENAARMHVERALDRLGAALAKRGITSTTAALSSALAQQIGAATPAGLAATVTGAALAQSSAGTAASAAVFLGLSKLQLAAATTIAAVGAAGYAWQNNANATLRAEMAALTAQQGPMATLRSENQRLAATAAEIELLRRDDAELKQLAQEVTEAQKANAEKIRFAQAKAAQQSREQSFQADIDRMNREGNALVNEYKALNSRANDPAQSADMRAKTAAAAKAKLAEIWAKQREVQALIAARANNPEFVAPRAELRQRESVAGEITARNERRVEADALSGSSTEPSRVSLSLPQADLATALAALEQATGLTIERDASLANVRGTVDLRLDQATKREVFRGVTQALEAQLNVVFEAKPDGTLVAKRAPAP